MPGAFPEPQTGAGDNGVSDPESGPVILAGSRPADVDPPIDAGIAGKIRQAQLVANPGCYPTAASLAIRPLVRDGLYDPAVDTATFVDELDYGGNPGGNPDSVVVFVVGDIPISRVNGDIAAYVLNAQVAEGGGMNKGSE